MDAYVAFGKLFLQSDGFFFLVGRAFFFFLFPMQLHHFSTCVNQSKRMGLKRTQESWLWRKRHFLAWLLLGLVTMQRERRKKKKKKKRKEEKWNILHWQPAAFIASRLRSPQEEGKREREQVLICLLDKNGAKTKGKKRYKPNWMAHRSIKHGGQYINQHANLWDAGHKGANHIARSKALQ